MLKNGVLNPDGSFATYKKVESSTQLTKMLMNRIKQVDNRTYFKVNEQLSLSSQDIEELLKVKAAFSLVVKELLEVSKLSTFDLKTIYLAGSLGLHTAPLDLEGLGFLPTGMHKRVKAVGNSSLRGAALLLQNKQARQAALDWTFHTTVLSLVDSDKFMDQYLDEMVFNW